MRTIDADKLRTWFESHSVWDEFTVGYIMGLIDEQPSVEAIPIPFIKHLEKVTGDPSLSLLLTAWEMNKSMVLAKEVEEEEEK